MKSLHKDMAVTLLTGMLMITYICEGALLKKSSASEFLQKIREKRDSECYPGGCSTEISEVEELTNENPGYDVNSNVLNNGHAGHRANQNAGWDPAMDDGSGM